MAISRELLEILACPQCKGDIHLNAAGNGLSCDRCKLLYGIRMSIPIMLVEEAQRIDATVLRGLQTRARTNVALRCALVPLIDFGLAAFLHPFAMSITFNSQSGGRSCCETRHLLVPAAASRGGWAT